MPNKFSDYFISDFDRVCSEKQGYRYYKLRKVVSKFYYRHPELIVLKIQYRLKKLLQPARERSGAVVECLTRDRRAAGSSLIGVTALWFLSKTHLS